ncbi:hypothetical protein Tco_1021599 [Tanacetum coccineum]
MTTLVLLFPSCFIRVLSYQLKYNSQQRLLQPHTRTYSTLVLTQKVFSNMKRVTKGYFREDIPLFASMITASETSPSRITSSPSLSPQHTPFTAPSTSQPSNIHTTPVTEEAASMPYELPLQSVHSLGRDEGSISLHELTVLCTNLSNKVTSLETELAQTKQTYGTALTKLIKKGRSLIEELDLDAEISLVPPHDSEIQEKISDDTEVLLEEEETTKLVEEPTELVEDQGSGEKGNKSTTPKVSTDAANLSKKQLEQEMLSHEDAIRLQEQIYEDERKRIVRDAEIAKQLQEEYDKAGKKEVVAEVDTAHVIDWNDPSVIRVGNYTEMYQVFEDMLKNFDRDDLVKLWSLVQERYNSSGLTEDKEIELWVELKMLFEPNAENLLELQKYMHDPLKWWLYDMCAVHHVSTEKGQDIFMLVEKDYPLTKGLATLMLCNKLRVDQQSEMADELLIKIYNIANRPRK